MKFRIRTIDSGCIEHFVNIVHMVSGLTKSAILRLRKSSFCLVFKERAVYGGVSVYCEVDYVKRICEGLSAEKDEILLEVVLDQLVNCLRIGAVASVGGSTFAASTTVGSAGVGPNSTLITSYPGFAHHSSLAVHGLKIKLVRRKLPCLALELEQASVTGRSRAVWHFIPVHVVPPRLWDEFSELPDPDFDVSIFFPAIKVLRPFADRMRKFAKFIVISANGAGELILGVNVETLARVRLTFRGLRARSWLPSASALESEDEEANEEPRSAIWAEGEGKQGVCRNSRTGEGMARTNTMDDVGDADRRLVSVSLDIRRFAQLLSCPRITPTWFVCNIVHEQMAQFVFLFDSCKLKYNIPASAL
ncbi:unnamed protein product [Calicophoron daubneyi]|uniref:Checkpoint protein n=1 Tax=Calicophoron daubneyi TaxID=300641 RepID=A0AAV2TF28_CALDB